MADQLVLFRICVVDGCQKQAGLPGTAKGMCAGHYHKLKKYGDPLADKRRTRQACSIDNCGKFVVGRSWCGTHYARWTVYGSPLPRLKGQVVEGKRICPRCEQDVSIEDFGRNASKPDGLAAYCKPCVAARQSEWRLANPDRPVLPRAPEVAREYSRAWRRRNPEKVRSATQTRRARRLGATVRPVSTIEVLVRDNWTCQICLEPIGPDLVYPDPMSSSIDHRIPLARGGEHSMTNCQAAHLRCNLRKYAKVG